MVFAMLLVSLTMFLEFVAGSMTTVVEHRWHGTTDCTGLKKEIWASLTMDGTACMEIDPEPKWIYDADARYSTKYSDCADTTMKVTTVPRKACTGSHVAQDQYVGAFTVNKSAYCEIFAGTCVDGKFFQDAGSSRKLAEALPLSHWPPCCKKTATQTKTTVKPTQAATILKTTAAASVPVAARAARSSTCTDLMLFALVAVLRFLV